MSSGDTPLFSVITPVYETPLALLEDLVSSVRAQSFTDWELVLVDDGSRSSEVHAALDDLEGDPAIRVLRRAENGGIVAASNDAVAAARGEMLAFVDHDDMLHPDALAEVAAVLGDDVDYVYTDSDLIDEAGRHSEPFYKPDWSPERFRCQMYTNHLGVLRRSLVEQVGGFRPGYEGAQDYDLVFRVTERARRIVHVPRVLYHWRITEQSVNASPDAKPYAWIASRAAVADHLERTGFEAEMAAADDELSPGVFQLVPRLRDEPLVSIVIPTGAGRRDIACEEVLLAERCVRSIVERSTYTNIEIVLVVDGHVGDDDRRRMLEASRSRARIVDYDEPFNFSKKCNLGVIASSGEHVVLLNDDTEVVAPGWLEAMLVYSRSPGVGAVGARLHFGDGRIQHAGLCFLPGVAPGHIYHGFQESYGGYYAMVHLPCNFLAVTGACLMTPRATYDELGGLAEEFSGAYNDVDYCLKVHSSGERVVYAPDAVLFHHESSSRSAEVLAWERSLLVDRWAGRYGGIDPYFSPNFRQDSVDFVRPLYFPDGTTVRG